MTDYWCGVLDRFYGALGFAAFASAVLAILWVSHHLFLRDREDDWRKRQLHAWRGRQLLAGVLAVGALMLFLPSPESVCP